jgi:hypothetical protein
MNEYVVVHLMRERMREAESWARRESAYREARRARDAAKSRPAIRNLGQLALVALTVMVIGVGVVGLWTAATEPRPRPEVLSGLTDGDELSVGRPGEEPREWSWSLRELRQLRQAR